MTGLITSRSSRKSSSGSWRPSRSARGEVETQRTEGGGDGAADALAGRTDDPSGLLPLSLSICVCLRLPSLPLRPPSLSVSISEARGFRRFPCVGLPSAGRDGSENALAPFSTSCLQSAQNRRIPPVAHVTQGRVRHARLSFVSPSDPFGRPSLLCLAGPGLQLRVRRRSSAGKTEAPGGRLRRRGRPDPRRPSRKGSPASASFRTCGIWCAGCTPSRLAAARHRSHRSRRRRGSSEASVRRHRSGRRLPEGRRLVRRDLGRQPRRGDGAGQPHFIICGTG